MSRKLLTSALSANRDWIFSAGWLLVAMAMAGTAQAAPRNYAFGTVSNETTAIAPDGECVAASFINGAVYLQNAYLSIYGSTKLSLGSADNDTAAMNAFGSGGWIGGTERYDGYYARVHGDGRNFGDWWQTIIDWTDTYAPGKTNYYAQVAVSLDGENSSGWEHSSNVSDKFPTYSFLSSAAAKNDYVELGVCGYTVENGNQLDITGGHAINLTDITHSGGVYTIYYQDPNFPNKQCYSATLSEIDINGKIAFDFYDSHTFDSNVFISAAYVLEAVGESSAPAIVAVGVPSAPAFVAVPEPSALVLLAVGGVGAIGVFGRARRPRGRIVVAAHPTEEAPARNAL